MSTILSCRIASKSCPQIPMKNISNDKINAIKYHLSQDLSVTAICKKIDISLKTVHTYNNSSDVSLLERKDRRPVKLFKRLSMILV